MKYLRTKKLVKFLKLFVEMETGLKSFVPGFSTVLYALDYVFESLNKFQMYMSKI